VDSLGRGGCSVGMLRVLLLLALVALAGVAARADDIRIGDWEVGERVNDFDDVRSTYALIGAEQGEGHFGASCSNNRTMAFLGGLDFIPNGVGGRDARLEWRVDGGPVELAELLASSASMGWSLGAPSIAMLRALKGGERLRVRYLDISYRAHTLSFDITGVDEALSHVSAACGWE